MIDPESAEAHNALAVAALLWKRDFGKAEREFREALALYESLVDRHTRERASKGSLAWW